MSLDSTPLRPHRCHRCGHYVDAATDPWGQVVAEAGDLSVCLYCGAIGVYQGSDALGLSVRPATAAERDQALAEVPRLRQVLAGRARVMGP